MSSDGSQATKARRCEEPHGDRRPPKRWLHKVRCAVVGPQVAMAVVMLLMVALAVWYLPDLHVGGMRPTGTVAAPPPGEPTGRLGTPGPETTEPSALGGEAPAREPSQPRTLTARTEATPRAFPGAPPRLADERSASDDSASEGSHADALLEQARRQRKTGDCRAAVHTYEAFLLGHRKHPSAPQVMLEVAQCHRRLDQRVRAKHWLTQATQHPQAAEAAQERLQALTEASR